jgi:hypothetical protein
LSAIAATSSAALASAPAHSSTTRGQRDRTSHPAVNPTGLWRTFPLGQRHVSKQHPIENAPSVSGTTHPKGRTRPPHHGRKSLRNATLGILFGSIALLLFVAALVLRKRGRAGSDVERERPRQTAVTTHPMHDARLRPLTGAAVPRNLTGTTDGNATAGDGAAVKWRRDGHLLFVPTSEGYTLVERMGDAPPVRREFDGAEFGLQGRFRVLKIVPSPLPGDKRDCAYLERA